MISQLPAHFTLGLGAIILKPLLRRLKMAPASDRRTTEILRRLPRNFGESTYGTPSHPCSASHAAAPARRHPLRERSEGQRPVLRQQATRRKSRGRRNRGSTTCARACISHSRRVRTKCNKVNLEILFNKDDTLDGSANLPSPPRASSPQRPWTTLKPP